MMPCQPGPLLVVAMETKIEPKDASEQGGYHCVHRLVIGFGLWLYGYFEAGHPTLIDWRTYTPWWIADFLPNMESEIGMALIFASTVPMYWPSGRESASHDRTSMASEA